MRLNHKDMEVVAWVAETQPRQWTATVEPNIKLTVTTPKDGHFIWHLIADGKLVASDQVWGPKHAMHRAEWALLRFRKGLPAQQKIGV